MNSYQRLKQKHAQEIKYLEQRGSELEALILGIVRDNPSLTVLPLIGAVTGDQFFTDVNTGDFYMRRVLPAMSPIHVDWTKRLLR